MKTKQYQVQEYLFEWYNLDNMLFNTLKEAKEVVRKRKTSRNKSNKRIQRKDFNMNGYGIEQNYPTRIIELNH